MKKTSKLKTNENKFPKDKKEFPKIIEEILDTEAVIQMIEESRYQKSMQDADNTDVTINHIGSIFTNETYYTAMKIVPLLEKKYYIYHMLKILD